MAQKETDKAAIAEKVRDLCNSLYDTDFQAIILITNKDEVFPTGDGQKTDSCTLFKGNKESWISMMLNAIICSFEDNEKCALEMGSAILSLADIMKEGMNEVCKEKLDND